MDDPHAESVKKELVQTFFPQVVNFVKSEHNLDATGNERLQRFFKSQIENMNPRYFLPLRDKQTLFKSVAGYLFKQYYNHKMDPEIDLHTIQVEQITKLQEQKKNFSDRELGVSPALKPPFNTAELRGTIGYSPTYETGKILPYNICLDSKNRNRTVDISSRSVNWILADPSYMTTGTVYGQGELRNVVSMQVSGCFLPYWESAQFWMLQYKQVSMRIMEFDETNVIVGPNWRYTTLFNAIPDGASSRINLIPVDGGYTSFRRPITKIDKFTIRWGFPFDEFDWEPDYLRVTEVEFGVNVISATDCRITTSERHYINTGDIVYFTGFTTDQPNADFLQIQNMNRPQGFRVNVIQYSAGPIENKFVFEFEMAGPAGTEDISAMEVYNGSQRQIIQMKFSFIGD